MTVAADIERRKREFMKDRAKTARLQGRLNPGYGACPTAPRCHGWLILVFLLGLLVGSGVLLQGSLRVVEGAHARIHDALLGAE